MLNMRRRFASGNVAACGHLDMDQMSLSEHVAEKMLSIDGKGRSMKSTRSVLAVLLVSLLTVGHGAAQEAGSDNCLPAGEVSSAEQTVNTSQPVLPPASSGEAVQVPAAQEGSAGGPQAGAGNQSQQQAPVSQGERGGGGQYAPPPPPNNFL